jgi:hypothetical protein
MKNPININLNTNKFDKNHKAGYYAWKNQALKQGYSRSDIENALSDSDKAGDKSDMDEKYGRAYNRSRN